MEYDICYQLNLFNSVKDYKRIEKPIRLIELFSGIGATSKGLDIIGVKYEHYKTCEWAVPSIRAYNAIHMKDATDYSKDLSVDQLIEYLDGNISINYNEPCNVRKKPEKWLREVYNNCIATHNLMNIMKVKGSDLEIVDTDKYEYLMTYSFPCQDLSLAGKRAGMSVSQADGGTRSGLLWEVERILKECVHKPQILIMENVPEVVGTGNLEDFTKWENTLSKLGYSNFLSILNGKNYGIPQNRKRAFMVSILGDYAYDFPMKLKLKYKLKDFLEKEVNEKYYLSQKLIDFFTYNTEKQAENGNGFTFDPQAEDSAEIAKTITTRNGSRMDDNYIENARLYETIQNKKLEDGDFIDTYNRAVRKDISGTITTRTDASNNTFISEYSNESLERIQNNIVDDEIVPTITANSMTSINHQNCSLIKEKSMGGVMIKNNNSKGYEIAHEGDGIDISSRMEYHRGTVQKGLSQTLTCVGGENVGVVVKDEK